MTNYNLEIPAIFGQLERVEYMSKKTNQQVKGARAIFIAEGLGVLEFSFGDLKLDVEQLKNFQVGERVRLITELIKGFQDKLTMVLVDVLPDRD